MCGIVTIYSKNAEGVEKDLSIGLKGVRHRGPDAAGANISNSESYVEARIKEEVNDHFLAMVSHMFISPPESGPPDVRGFGHTRYTTEDNILNPHNAQPYRAGDGGSRLKIVFNGNIPNHKDIRRNHLAGQTSFQTLGDTETLARFMLHRVQDAMSTTSGNIRASITEAVRGVLGNFDGGYSVTGDFMGHMFAFKDPYGIRPLTLGKKDKRVILASENHFFEKAGYAKVGEFPNGHLLIIGPDDELINGFPEPQNLLTENLQPHPDTFEFVYLGHRLSDMFGTKVHELRTDLGRYAVSELLQFLGGKHNFDIVVSVPNGANDMKLGACEVLGISPDGPNGLEKALDVRSFMASTQIKREHLVRMKFLINEDVIRGKNILLIDDSIVRGTTMKVLVDMLLKAGAKSVYVLSASPKVYYGDRYGIAMSTDQLVARDISDSHMLSTEDIERLLFSDLGGQQLAHVFFPSIEGFSEVFKKHGMPYKHAAYFDGNYIHG